MFYPPFQMGCGPHLHYRTSTFVLDGDCWLLLMQRYYNVQVSEVWDILSFIMEWNVCLILHWVALINRFIGGTWVRVFWSLYLNNTKFRKLLDILNGLYWLWAPYSLFHGSLPIQVNSKYIWTPYWALSSWLDFRSEDWTLVHSETISWMTESLFCVYLS